MGSFYDENPAALEAALDRKAFEDSLLDGTNLKHFLAADPENAAQERARCDLRTILERAYDAAQHAQQAAFMQGAVVRA